MPENEYFVRFDKDQIYHDISSKGRLTSSLYKYLWLQHVISPLFGHLRSDFLSLHINGDEASPPCRTAVVSLLGSDGVEVPELDDRLNELVEPEVKLHVGERGGDLYAPDSLLLALAHADPLPLIQLLASAGT